jgi:hypothetical protein
VAQPNVSNMVVKKEEEESHDISVAFTDMARGDDR